MISVGTNIVRLVSLVNAFLICISSLLNLAIYCLAQVNITLNTNLLMAERLIILELRKEERIDKWRPLFQAATASMIATEGGIQRALQLLPAIGAKFGVLGGGGPPQVWG